MRGMLAVLLSIIVAMICWGTYGPILQQGKFAMEGSNLRPFICVGLAYFVIAVVVPLAIIAITGEKGKWSPTGIIWSLVAGAAGALGALGIILAFAYRGNPLFVMPLVFGCAPVVNTFYTMYSTRSYRQAGPIFIAGLILVVAGAVTVLFFRGDPHASAAHVTTERNDQGVAVEVSKEADGVEQKTRYTAASFEELKQKHPDAAKLYQQHSPLSMHELTMVFVFTFMTAFCWGVYGPTLHKGQSAMAGSRLRPFICVGLAYFLIAVLVPGGMLTVSGEAGEFTTRGTMLSLASGAAGAIGALGIIMAFNFGGKPIYVMPLVFGGAPVINTAVSLRGNFAHVHPVFYAGLILVIVGAVTVLVFAPKGGHGPAKHEEPEPSPEAAPA